MNQYWTHPVVGLSQMKYGSPLVAAAFTLHGLLLVTVVMLATVPLVEPVMNHTCSRPVVGSCITRSGTPSPLKSVVAATCNGVLAVTAAAEPRVTPCAP